MRILIVFVAPMCTAIWSDPSKYIRILMIRGGGRRHVHRAVAKITKHLHQLQQEIVSGLTLLLGIVLLPETFACR